MYSAESPQLAHNTRKLIANQSTQKKPGKTWRIRK